MWFWHLPFYAYKYVAASRTNPVMRFNFVRSVNDMCRIACLINFHHVYSFIIIALLFRVREKFSPSAKEDEGDEDENSLPRQSPSRSVRENCQTENMTFIDDDEDEEWKFLPQYFRHQPKRRKAIKLINIPSRCGRMSLCALELVNQLSN